MCGTSLLQVWILFKLCVSTWIKSKVVFWQTFVFDKKGVGMDSLLGKTTVAKQLEAYFGIVRVDPEMVVELAIAYAIAGKKSLLQILH